jgi:hypothetical protein
VDEDSPSKETTPPAMRKADQAAARKRLCLEKEHKQRVFIDACTIGDVVDDAENPKKVKGYKDTKALQSIKAACRNLLGANALRHFMINNKLQTIVESPKGKCAP